MSGRHAVVPPARDDTRDRDAGRRTGSRHAPRRSRRRRRDLPRAEIPEAPGDEEHERRGAAHPGGRAAAAAGPGPPLPTSRTTGTSPAPEQATGTGTAHSPAAPAGRRVRLLLAALLAPFALAALVGLVLLRPTGGPPPTAEPRCSNPCAAT